MSRYPIPTMSEAEVEKIYFRVGEVAEELGINTSHVRWLAVVFGLQTGRDRRGRKFTADQVEQLRLIYTGTLYFHYGVVRDLMAVGKLREAVVTVRTMVYHQ